MRYVSRFVRLFVQVEGLRGRVFGGVRKGKVCRPGDTNGGDERLSARQ